MSKVVCNATADARPNKTINPTENSARLFYARVVAPAGYFHRYKVCNTFSKTQETFYRSKPLPLEFEAQENLLAIPVFLRLRFG